MGIKGLIRLLLCMSLLTATSAWAAEIHGRSSTQFLSFGNYLLDGKRQTELNECLRLAITDIDKDHKLSIYGYGRISQDFTNGEGLHGRLYYLYGDYRDLFDRIDIKIGRQFVNLAAGTAIIDGAQVDVKNVGPVGFTVLGGRDVIFGINGEAGDPSNTDLGLAAYLVGFKKTDLEVSWFRKWDQGDTARDLLGATFKQYLFNTLNVYGNARFDLVSETFAEVQGGIKYFPSANWIFTGEYFQSYPKFDTTSIYSVFAVDRYREAVFRAEYIYSDKLSVNGGFTREWFGEGSAANVWHAGVGLRPIEPLRVNLEYDRRHGYYGRQDGVTADVSYDVGKAGQLGVGFDYDVYRRDSMTAQETARRYWLGGRYKLARNMALSARLQDDVNHEYEENILARVVFDYDF